MRHDRLLRCKVERSDALRRVCGMMRNLKVRVMRGEIRLRVLEEF